MPYYCSCLDKNKNTLTSTVLGRQKQDNDSCLELQQVQFRIYEAAPRSKVLNWAQTFTLTPEKPVVLCRDGKEHSVQVPWQSITESLMEVTKVRPYGSVTTTISPEGSISFDKFNVTDRCNNLCPLTFNSILNPATAIQPFRTTT